MGLNNLDLEKIRDGILRDSIMSDEFLGFMEENMKPYNSLLAYYRCAIMEIETKFKVLNEQFSLQYDRNPIESIKSRIKSNESLIRKIRDRKIPLTLEAIEENITDIAGVRVICSFPEDIYMLADCLLNQDDIELIKEKDYIKNPKPGGYRSLHLIVQVPIFLQNEKRNMKVEVQLRTIAMDFWASLEHKLRYKKNIPEKQAQELAYELKQCSEISSQLDARMQEIRNRITLAENAYTEKKDAYSKIPLFNSPFGLLSQLTSDSEENEE
ncbi:MAG: GTP pyrophosphokinase family protein [Clostridiales bacterium]|nr:GTP pyrophosphokinase family protein [Clostridiales bacterium]